LLEVDYRKGPRGAGAREKGRPLGKKNALFLGKRRFRPPGKGKRPV